jgi:hypothetical protein
MEALKRVYGKSAVQFDNDARQWARQKATVVERLKVAAPVNPKIDETVLSDVEVQIAQATVGASTQAGHDKSQHYSRLSKLAGDACQIQAALGDLAFAAALPSKAATHYRQAIECGAAPKELAEGIAESISYGPALREEDVTPLAALGGGGRFSFLVAAGLFHDRDYEGALRESKRQPV